MTWNRFSTWRCSATTADHSLTTPLIRCQLRPWWRAAARSVMTLTSATRHRRRRRVRQPSNLGWSARWRVEQLSHTNPRLCRTSVVRRPDTSRSRTLRRQRLCTRQQWKPHARSATASPSTRPLPSTRSACPPAPPAHGSRASAAARSRHRKPSGPARIVDVSITDSSRAPIPTQGSSTHKDMSHFSYCSIILSAAINISAKSSKLRAVLPISISDLR